MAFYNKDCMSVMKNMANSAVTMTLTDIPYNECHRANDTPNRIRDNKQLEQADTLDIPLDVLTNEIIRITSGSIYMFCGIGQISEINSLMRSAGLSTRLCTWQKPNPIPMHGQHMWLSATEYCVFGRKAKATFTNHCKTNVWKFATISDRIHPTQKPLKLFEYLIESSSNKNDIVFDPFSGSGTTGVACKHLSRQFIGCEIYPEYYELANERIQSTQEADELFIF